MQDKIFTPGGNKDYQRGGDKADRSRGFKDWHFHAGDGMGKDGSNIPLYMIDLDCIEFGYRDGRPVPLAILELTRVDSADMVNDTYLNNIMDRVYARDAQGDVVLSLARMLGVAAYYVLHSLDLESYWVHTLDGDWIGKAADAEEVRKHTKRTVVQLSAEDKKRRLGSWKPLTPEQMKKGLCHIHRRR